jgi:hypothetical protein
MHTDTVFIQVDHELVIKGSPENGALFFNGNPVGVYDLVMEGENQGKYRLYLPHSEKPDTFHVAGYAGNTTEAFDFLVNSWRKNSGVSAVLR